MPRGRPRSSQAARNASYWVSGTDADVTQVNSIGRAEPGCTRRGAAGKRWRGTKRPVVESANGSKKSAPSSFGSTKSVYVTTAASSVTSPVYSYSAVVTSDSDPEDDCGRQTYSYNNATLASKKASAKAGAKTTTRASSKKRNFEDYSDDDDENDDEDSADQNSTSYDEEEEDYEDGVTDEDKEDGEMLHEDETGPRLGDIENEGKYYKEKFCNFEYDADANQKEEADDNDIDYEKKDKVNVEVEKESEVDVGNDVAEYERSKFKQALKSHSRARRMEKSLTRASSSSSFCSLAKADFEQLSANSEKEARAANEMLESICLPAVYPYSIETNITASRALHARRALISWDGNIPEIENCVEQGFEVGHAEVANEKNATMLPMKLGNDVRKFILESQEAPDSGGQEFILIYLPEENTFVLEPAPEESFLISGVNLNVISSKPTSLKEPQLSGDKTEGLLSKSTFKQSFLPPPTETPSKPMERNSKATDHSLKLTEPKKILLPQTSCQQDTDNFVPPKDKSKPSEEEKITSTRISKEESVSLNVKPSSAISSRAVAKKEFVFSKEKVQIDEKSKATAKKEPGLINTGFGSNESLSGAFTSTFLLSERSSETVEAEQKNGEALLKDEKPLSGLLARALDTRLNDETSTSRARYSLDEEREDLATLAARYAIPHFGDENGGFDDSEDDDDSDAFDNKRSRSDHESNE